MGFDVGIVEHLLRERFGDDVAVAQVQPIRPWAVARCHLTGMHAPPTVVVKWLRENPDGFRTAPRRITTDAAALRLLDDVAPGVAPRLVGHRPDADVDFPDDYTLREPFEPDH